MQAFEYARPETVNAAVRLLESQWGPTELLAGGTDLLARLKDNISAPQRVISLNGIGELRGIAYNSRSGLRIGARVTFEELLDDPAVRRHYPGIIDAIEGVSSPQIRNMGTVAGDLCQRPRCWYYRNGYGLLGQLNGQSLIPHGENRFHAILGNGGPAYFVNPSSLAPMLIALGARVEARGQRGREIPLDRFFVTPTGPGQHENALAANEVITAIRVPSPGSLRTATYEVRQKTAMDWPLAVAAVALEFHGGAVRRARVVLGHVAPVPWPAPEAETALAGRELNEASTDAAGQAAVAKAVPLSQNGYKVQLARVAVKRALLRAGGRA